MTKLKSLLIATLVAVGVGMSASAEMNYVKIKTTPAVQSSLGEFGKDSKDDATAAKQLKKNLKASRIEVQRWADGTEHKIVYLKDKIHKGAFLVLNQFDMTPVTDVEIYTIDGSDYYHAWNRHTLQHFLSTPDNRTILSKTGSLALLDDGEDKIWFTMKDNQPHYYTFDGKYLLSIQGSSTNFETTPAIQEGIKKVVFAGDTVEMYSPAYPKYYYAQTSDKYDLISLFYCDNFSHVAGNIDPNRDVFYPAIGAGYFFTTYEPDVYFSKNTRHTELGGNIIEVHELVSSATGQPVGVRTANTQTLLSNVTDVAYCTDSHAFIYSSRDRMANCQGAIFLRDRSLDIPPRFCEAGYLYNAQTDKWEPWVRRKLYTKSEPYVAGMEDTEITYGNLGEQLVNEGQYNDAFSKYYNSLPDDYKWTKRDLNHVNYAGFSGGIKRLEEAHFKGLMSISEDIDYNSCRLAVDIIDKNLHLHCANNAMKIFDRAIANPADKATAEYAASLKADMENSIKLLNTWAADIKAEKEGYIAAVDKARRDKADLEERIALYQAQAKAEAEQRRIERQQQQQADNSALMYGIMSVVSNSINRAFGVGNRRHGPVVTYTGSGNQYGGAAAAPAATSPSQASGGATVETAKKCTRCGGSGSCSACQGHPGYATAGDRTHKCHGCHGSGRCSYCGGTGYRH